MRRLSDLLVLKGSASGNVRFRFGDDVPDAESALVRADLTGLPAFVLGRTGAWLEVS